MHKVEENKNSNNFENNGNFFLKKKMFKKQKDGLENYSNSKEKSSPVIEEISAMDYKTKTIVKNYSTPCQTTKPTVLKSRECNSIINGSAYLDIVFIFDTSKGSNEHGLMGQKASVATLLSALKIGQGSNKPVSRVSFIAASNNPTIISDLNEYQSLSSATKDLLSIKWNKNGGSKLDVNKALKAADSVIKTTGRNSYFPKIIFLFYSPTNEMICQSKTKFSHMYDITNDSPCRTATNIKNEGTIIMTSALNYLDGSSNTINNDIASPCFAIGANEFYTKFPSLFTYANCFCPPQYSQYFDTKTCKKRAECLYIQKTPSNYVSAKMFVEAYGAELVDIRDEVKQSFVVEVAKKTYPFFIGLNQLDNLGVWKWDTGYILNGSSYKMFANDNQNKVGKCAVIKHDGLWYSVDCYSYTDSYPYIYQIYACDAGNFCNGKDQMLLNMKIDRL